MNEEKNVNAPQDKVIGKDEIRKAYVRMKKYKEAKANLESRVIENEQWWKMRHWDYIRGDQAKDKDEPTSAWLFNSIANKHADAMDNYPEPCVLPRAQDDEEAAKQLSSVLPVVIEQNNYEKVYSQVWWYKLKQGTGIKGIFWDNTKMNGLGDVAIKKIDILNVFWQPGITDIQESRDFFCVELVDNELLTQLYPDANVQGNQFSEVSSYIYDDHIDKTDKSLVVDWYYKKSVKAQDGTIQTKLHYVKFVNDYVIFASENEPEYAERGYYDHGKYPFVFDTLFEVEGSPVGFGYIDVMRNPQMYIDKLDKAILINAGQAAKRRWFVKDSLGVNEEEFNDYSKSFIHVTGNITPESMKELTVSEMSSMVPTVRNNKIEELKETSGNRDFSQGSTSSGVTAASAISALMEAGSKLSRDMIKSSYRAFQEECYFIIELMRQFYDTPRYFRITGEKGQQEFVSFDNSMIMAQQQGIEFGVELGERLPVFDVKVEASKKSTYSKMAQNELALEFYKLGFFNPQNTDQTLACIDMMDFDGKEKIIQKIEQNGTMYQQIMALTQQVNQLTALLGINPGMNQVPMNTSQQPVVNVDTNTGTDMADKTREVAANMAAPK